MSKIDIYIRDIDSAVKAKLETISRQKGISLNVLVKTILSDYAIMPDIRLMNDKYENLFKDMTTLYNYSLEKNEEIISENTALLRTILELIKS